MEFSPEHCPMPVHNPLAAAARSKMCGADVTSFVTGVPMRTQSEEVQLTPANLCVKHAYEIIVKKFVHALYEKNLKTKTYKLRLEVISKVLHGAARSPLTPNKTVTDLHKNLHRQFRVEYIIEGRMAVKEWDSEKEELVGDMIPISKEDFFRNYTEV